MNDDIFREWFKLCVETRNKMIEAKELFEKYMCYCDKYEAINFTKEQEKSFEPYVDEMVECLLYFSED